MTISLIYRTESIDPDGNRAVAAWVAQRIWGDGSGFGLCATMAVYRGVELIGAVVFHDWQPDSGTIEMSCAGDKGWLTRRVVNGAFWFCFDAMGAQMTIAQARADNDAALRVDRALFKEETKIRRRFGSDCDGHVFTLTREEWLTHLMRGGKT